MIEWEQDVEHSSLGINASEEKCKREEEASPDHPSNEAPRLLHDQFLFLNFQSKQQKPK